MILKKILYKYSKLLFIVDCEKQLGYQDNSLKVNLLQQKFDLSMNPLDFFFLYKLFK
jgi:hypothetical protein